MRIFEKNEKTNFVDENDVYVGFDRRQNCCEHASWIISHSLLEDFPRELEEKPPVDLEDFRFDPDYFLSTKDTHSLYCGGLVIFKLVNTNTNRELFLHIYNSQNGFYSHGFTMEVDRVIVRKGYV